MRTERAAGRLFGHVRPEYPYGRMASDHEGQPRGGGPSAIRMPGVLRVIAVISQSAAGTRDLAIFLSEKDRAVQELS
jgi:hypothetical protein